jgi:hypothetical protein
MPHQPLVYVLAIFLLLGNSGHVESASVARHQRLTQVQFRALMETVARGWNSNNASLAADCFTDDAVYSAPPDTRVRIGKKQLFDFFGGEKGRDQPMHMEWHHLIFAEDEQIGAGEYTFTYKIRTHGAVIVRLVNGKIANWREYERESRLDWDHFIGSNRF